MRKLPILFALLLFTSTAFSQTATDSLRVGKTGSARGFWTLYISTDGDTLYGRDKDGNVYEISPTPTGSGDVSKSDSLVVFDTPTHVATLLLGYLKNPDSVRLKQYSDDMLAAARLADTVRAIAREDAKLDTASRAWRDIGTYVELAANGDSVKVGTPSVSYRFNVTGGIYGDVLYVDESDAVNLTGGVRARRTNGAAVPLLIYDETGEKAVFGNFGGNYQQQTDIYGGNGNVNLFTNTANSSSVTIQKTDGTILGLFNNNGKFGWGGAGATDSVFTLTGSAHFKNNFRLDGNVQVYGQFTSPLVLSGVHLGLYLNQITTIEEGTLTGVLGAFWWNITRNRPHFYDGVEVEEVFTLNDYNDSLRAAQMIVGAPTRAYTFVAADDSLGGGPLNDSSGVTTITQGNATTALRVRQTSSGDIQDWYSGTTKQFAVEDDGHVGVTAVTIYRGSGALLTDVAGAGHTIRDSTTVFTQRDTLEILGNLVEVTDEGGVKTRVVVNGVALDTSATSGAGTALQLNTAKTQVTSVAMTAGDTSTHLMKSTILMQGGVGTDSVLIATNYKVPMGYSTGVVIDTVIYIGMASTTRNVKFRVNYGTDISAAGTLVDTTTVTSNTTATKQFGANIDAATIPAGNMIWLDFPTVTSSFKTVMCILVGHKQ